MVYAAGTQVSIEKTQQQIRKLVLGKNATDYFVGEQDGLAHVAFRHSGRNIRFTLPTPRRSEAKSEARWTQESRSRWRGLLLCIKAKFESVESNIETFEEAFLAQVQTPSGRTVYEEVKGALALSYRENRAIPLLPPPPRKED